MKNPFNKDEDGRWGIDVPEPVYWIVKLTPIAAWIFIIIVTIVEGF